MYDYIYALKVFPASSVATDDEYEHGLKLEKVGPLFQVLITENKYDS